VTACGVLLAAGAGSRFAGVTHKLLTPLDERPLVEHALGAVLAAGLDEVVVVTGAVDLTDLLAGRAVTQVVNDRWSDGIATSLRAGVAAARRSGHDAVVVGLGDQPGVTSEAWRAVAACTASPIAVATYDGTRGNPVRLAAKVWRSLPSDGDEGARRLQREHPDLVTEVPCEGTPADIDTVEELNGWRSAAPDQGGNP
jgi:CTP:molybdopterin cytidylyltransferase MocA